MLLLQIVLAFKILVTLALWSAPLAVAAADRSAGFELRLMRALLATAYLALVVAYTAGFQAARSDQVLWWVIAMGLVSNGGGSLLLTAALRSAQGVQRLQLAASLAATASVTVGLATSAVLLR